MIEEWLDFVETEDFLWGPMELRCEVCGKEIEGLPPSFGSSSVCLRCLRGPERNERKR